MAVRTVVLGIAAAAALEGAAAARPFTDPWADAVVSYSPGIGADGYDDPSSSIGEPARYTGELLGFPGCVTPFNPAFEANELVVIGRSGSLVVRFNEPVVDDDANPFGIDLLVFGNSFYQDVDYPNGVAGSHGDDGGAVEVSADGVHWVLVGGASADGGFPTLGYADLTDPYAVARGNVLTDFTRPVDPSFVATGKPFDAIVSAYAGSGGGLGIDLRPTGLAAVSYVRVTTPASASQFPEIDGFADARAVPAPGACASFGAWWIRGRRRRA